MKTIEITTDMIDLEKYVADWLNERASEDPEYGLESVL
jgi:hypothetical protein